MRKMRNLFLLLLVLLTFVVCIEIGNTLILDGDLIDPIPIPFSLTQIFRPFILK